MSVITRIAPSPTGYLHIGTARTALFNYLYARKHGGEFLLRVEDTDRARHNEDAVQAIYDSLTWLGIEWDSEPISQFANRHRHAEVAKELVAKGAAYYCYTPKEELDNLRSKAQAKGEHFRFQSPWRDADAQDAPKNIEPVIRIKAPLEGETTINDEVQGVVTVQNTQLDDFILLRSDETPTYMLSVVVDDHDMGITHVIRGDDHLNNAFRQKIIFDAMGWDFPVMAHLPLIHGEDGKKLSKRHGAVGVQEFNTNGYLPEAVINALLRLGWSHGDEEIMSLSDAIKWFELSDINKAAARLDYKKLEHLNAHYIQQCDNHRLVDLTKDILAETLDRKLSGDDLKLYHHALDGLKPRAKQLNDLAHGAAFYFAPLPLEMDEKAANKIAQEDAPLVLQTAIEKILVIDAFTQDIAHQTIQDIVTALEMKMGQVGPVLRAALCGTMQAPDLSIVIDVLGKKAVLERLESALDNL